jgi:NAD+ diphosphatase
VAVLPPARSTVDGLPPLARSTLDRAAHRRTDEAWLAEAWKRARVLLVDEVRGGRALVREADGGGVELVYADADRSLWGPAEWSVQAQLDYLRGQR